MTINRCAMQESYRGGEYSVDLLPNVKLETALQGNAVEAAVNAIIANASTGKIGDGKIFLYKVRRRSGSVAKSEVLPPFDVFVCIGQNVATTGQDSGTSASCLHLFLDVVTGILRLCFRRPFASHLLSVYLHHIY